MGAGVGGLGIYVEQRGGDGDVLGSAALLLGWEMKRMQGLRRKDRGGRIAEEGSRRKDRGGRIAVVEEACRRSELKTVGGVSEEGSRSWELFAV